MLKTVLFQKNSNTKQFKLRLTTGVWSARKKAKWYVETLLFNY